MCHRHDPWRRRESRACAEDAVGEGTRTKAIDATETEGIGSTWFKIIKPMFEFKG
jgi:hypothetical protein